MRAPIQYPTSLTQLDHARGLIRFPQTTPPPAAIPKPAPKADAAQRLFMVSEKAARSPGEHLARQQLAIDLARIDMDAVMANARWPQVARALWVAASGLATATDDHEASAHATLINAANVHRWRSAQSKPKFKSHRTDLD